MTEQPIEIHELDLKRFNALAGGSRSAALEFYGEEIGWYSNADETLLGVVLRDLIDGDFAAVVLTRDETRRYSCFDLDCSQPTKNAAREWLIRTMKWHTG